MVINLQAIVKAFLLALLSTLFITLFYITFFQTASIETTSTIHFIEEARVNIPTDTTGCTWTGGSWINPEGQIWDGNQWTDK